MPRQHPDLKASFSRLKNEDKRKLSTGKLIEDNLYSFSQKCIVDHPSCSMIVDVDDRT